MRRSIESSTPSIIFLLTAQLISASAITSRSFLGVDYDPAPSPEDGPPASAGALRDPKYLPAEIGGIVGAYVFVVSVIGIAILLIGRRLRREAEKGRIDIELLTPPKLAVEAYSSPISPGSKSSHQRNFSYPASPDLHNKNPYVFPNSSISPVSPVGSDPNVDHYIVQADRQKMDRGLEDIYAHVMEQEDAKAAGMKVSEMPPPGGLPIQKTQGMPAEAPQRISKPKKKPMNLDMSEKTHSRASSIISSILSPGKKKPQRVMEISSPIPTPMRSSFPQNYAEDEEPLTPRYYNPPPPPAVPKDQIPYTHSRNTSKASTDDPSPTSPAKSIAESLQAYNVPQHRYAQSQISTASEGRRGTPLLSNPSGIPRPMLSPGLPKMPLSQLARQSPHPPSQASINSISTSTRAPIALRIPTIATAAGDGQTSTASLSPQPQRTTAISIGSTQRSLPFRAFDPPGHSSASISSQQTKTTVLERTNAATLSPGLKTPWSAGAVPYSPYQPFSPLMPVTPRLVTREERKAREKEEKKRRVPVLDLVESEEDRWGGAY